MLLALLTVPAFGAYSPGTDTPNPTLQRALLLHNMGLYAGTNPNQFTPDLEGSLNREQGIVLLLRLLGQERAALAMTEAERRAALARFSDRSSIPDWARGYIALAIQRNIVGGFPDGTIRPGSPLTGNQFATLLLRGAGYTVTDFSQATANFGQRAGITGSSFLSMGPHPLLRLHAVDMSFGYLGLPLPGQNLTFIQNLVNKGIVPGSAAQQAGFSITAPPVSTTSGSSLSATGEQINKTSLDVTTGTGKALATDQD